MSSKTTLVLFAPHKPRSQWLRAQNSAVNSFHFEHKKPILRTSLTDLVVVDICLRERVSDPTIWREFYTNMVSFHWEWPATFFKLVARVRTILSAMFAGWHHQVTVLHTMEFVHVFIVDSFPNLLSTYDFHNPKSCSSLLWSSIGHKNYENLNEPVDIISHAFAESPMTMSTEYLKRHLLLQYQKWFNCWDWKLERKEKNSGTGSYV